MPRRNRLPIVFCVLALSPAVACLAGVGGVAAAAAGCTSRTVPNPHDSHHFTYYNLISSKGVGCATRNRVEDGFENCRLKHGLRGRCHATELGFNCKEAGPRQDIGFAFNATVSCRSAGKHFTYAYQQN